MSVNSFCWLKSFTVVKELTPFAGTDDENNDELDGVTCRHGPSIQTGQNAEKAPSNFLKIKIFFILLNRLYLTGLFFLSWEKGGLDKISVSRNNPKLIINVIERYLPVMMI